jgi:cytosine/adenosine deaminase-related metal-dependent hydrolase
MRMRIETSNAALGVVDGRIVSADGPFDVSISIPDGEIRPGLINAHDHLHRNHYGRLGAPPYPNAYQWGRDIHARDALAIALGRVVPRREALLTGAWKNLRAGVTTVVHHDALEPDFADGFPIRVAALATAHSLGFAREVLPIALTAPFAMHLAEGIDGGSADEIREVDRLGLLTAHLIAVHVVGADADGVERFRRSGAAVTWCPTSNAFLFARTAPMALLADGVDVLLGSDSLLTGQGSLLEEIRCAHALGMLSNERIEGAVGAVAARRLGLVAPSLETGAPADLVVLLRPLLEATEADVALVVCDGTLRVLSPELIGALGARASHGRCIEHGGVMRWIYSGRVVLSDPRTERRSRDARSLRRARQ